MNTLELQRSLYRLGYDVGGCDGIMGPKTQAAVALLQQARELTPDVDVEIEIKSLIAYEKLPPFIEAKNYSRANRVELGVVVIHTAETPEIHKEAVNVANFFAGIGCTAPQASAHYVVDDSAVIQCVLECDMAWHAGSGNGHSIGIEHAGYASQTPEQWDDDYSRAVLANSAKLVARLCKRFDIPIVRITPAELAAGAKGFCGHCDVNDAFSKPGSGHRDPGISFPWATYLAMITGAPL
jgi:N-acetyl-anhydromuramyl-L-alanine amidase AmpD